MQWSTLLPPAAETTPIPLEGDRGHIGALMYLACLAYPEKTKASHSKRDAYMTAIGEYLDGKKAYSLGRRRRQKGSRPTHQTRERLFNVLNRADHQIRVRLKLADMAYNLCGKNLVESAFGAGPLRITVSGPSSLSKALENLEGRDARTWWRAWERSLPVMHLALALRHATEEVDLDGEPLSLALMRRQSDWLEEAIRRVPFETVALQQAIPTYRPADRVDLVQR